MFNVNDIKSKREERVKLIADAGVILEAGEGENGALSDEQEVRFDEMHTAADVLLVEIERMERQGDAERALPSPTIGAQREDPAGVTIEDLTPEHEREFMDWVRNGNPAAGEGADHRNVNFFRVRPLRSGVSMAEYRAETDPQETGDNTEGGSFVPRGFSGRLEQALLEFGGMRRARTTVIRTDGGGTMDWPTADDTDQEGALLSENASDTVQKIDTGVKTLDAYKYTSKIVKVSVELLQDSAFDFDSFVGARLGERIGRITNRHFTVGTGSSQPNGLLTASAAGATAAGEASIEYDDLIELEHSVDPAYRDNAEYMFHDSTLKALKKIKDSQNRPLWLPGLAVKAPDTILDYRYVINQHMPTMLGAVKSVLFGDFSTYVIRDVRGVILLRLVERYADSLQVGFIAFSRHDGEYINAGTDPVKHMVHPS